MEGKHGLKPDAEEDPSAQDGAADGAEEQDEQVEEEEQTETQIADSGEEGDRPKAVKPAPVGAPRVDGPVVGDKAAKKDGDEKSTVQEVVESPVTWLTAAALAAWAAYKAKQAWSGKPVEKPDTSTRPPDTQGGDRFAQGNHFRRNGRDLQVVAEQNGLIITFDKRAGGEDRIDQFSFNERVMDKVKVEFGGKSYEFYRFKDGSDPNLYEVLEGGKQMQPINSLKAFTREQLERGEPKPPTAAELLEVRRAAAAEEAKAERRLAEKEARTPMRDMPLPSLAKPEIAQKFAEKLSAIPAIPADKMALLNQFMTDHASWVANGPELTLAVTDALQLRDPQNFDWKDQQKMTELLKDHPRLLAACKEYWAIEARMHKAYAELAPTLEARHKAIERAINEVLTSKEVGLPPLKVRLEMEVRDARAAYYPGTGEIAISLKDAATLNPEQIGMIGQESTHFEQDCRNLHGVADAAGIEKTGGDRMFGFIARAYKTRFGNELNKDFFASIVEARDGQPLSEDQERRAQEIRKSMAEVKDPMREKIERSLATATFAREALLTTQSPESVLRKLPGDPYLCVQLFGSEVPPAAVQKHLDALSEGKLDRATALKDLQVALTERVQFLTDLRLRVYFTDFHEREGFEADRVVQAAAEKIKKQKEGTPETAADRIFERYSGREGLQSIADATAANVDLNRLAKMNAAEKGEHLSAAVKKAIATSLGINVADLPPSIQQMRVEVTKDSAPQLHVASATVEGKTVNYPVLRVPERSLATPQAAMVGVAQTHGMLHQWATMEASMQPAELAKLAGTEVKLEVHQEAVQTEVRYALRTSTADPFNAGDQAFKELPQRLQGKFPSEFNPDIKEALERVLERNRTKWPADKVERFRALIDGYGREEADSVRRVTEMLAEGKLVHEAKTLPAPDAKLVEAADRVAVDRTQHTPELQAPDAGKPQTGIETYTTPDGIKFLKAIPIAELSTRHVEEKMKNIEGEIRRAREAGLHEYADELKRMQAEYDGKKTPAEREAFCKSVADRMKSAHETASRDVAAHGRGGGIAAKAGTTVAVLLVAGWLMDVTAPRSVAQPHSPRVLPGKK